MKRPTVGIATDGAHSFREVVLTYKNIRTIENSDVL